MKKFPIFLSCIIFILSMLVVLLAVIHKNAIDNFEDDFNLNIPPSSKVIFEEKDVAFDGTSLFSVIQISNDNLRTVANQAEKNEWSELPVERRFADELTKKIEILSQKGTEFINLNCKNGYFIIRRNSPLKKPAENTDVSNLKIAVLDLDKGKIYYCKWTH